jgi:NitT/TauT family transport system substrate-binding protein
MKPSLILKFSRKVITIALLFFLLASCTTSPVESVAQEPLLVEYTAGWGDYTMLVAQQKDLFEKYGVNVEPVYYDSFSRVLPDLASGQIDGGLFAIGDAVNVSRHTDLKVVAAYDSGTVNTIVSIPAVTKVEDLKGKRIGVAAGLTHMLLISEMLKSARLSLADVVLVNVNPKDVASSLGLSIDAGFVHEPYTSEAVTKGNNPLMSSAQFAGNVPDVIVFRAATVKNRENDVRAFLKAWFEAAGFRIQNPNEANQIIADYLNVPVSQLEPDNSLRILTPEDNFKLFRKDSKNNTDLFAATKLQSDFLISMGLLSSPPVPENLIDPAYLPE